jgi:hypothetical protein
MENLDDRGNERFGVFFLKFFVSLKFTEAAVLSSSATKPKSPLIAKTEARLRRLIIDDCVNLFKTTN